MTDYKPFIAEILKLDPTSDVSQAVPQAAIHAGLTDGRAIYHLRNVVVSLGVTWATVMKMNVQQMVQEVHARHNEAPHAPPPAAAVVPSIEVAPHPAPAATEEAPAPAKRRRIVKTPVVVAPSQEQPTSKLPSPPEDDDVPKFGTDIPALLEQHHRHLLRTNDELRAEIRALHENNHRLQALVVRAYSELRRMMSDPEYQAPENL